MKTDKTILIDEKALVEEDPEGKMLKPGVIRALAKLSDFSPFLFVLLKDDEPSKSFIEKTIQLLENEHIFFSETINRENIRTANFSDASFVISTDSKLLNFYQEQITILLQSSETASGEQDAHFSANSWKEIAEYLMSNSRVATIHRKTKETDVKVRLNLDGSGKANISTGLKFFDHMLDQLAHHGKMDLEIQVSGDLEVDEHHTIEDTAITLGQALNKALGNKKGIERYGFYVPMDDALSHVAIDFSGRRWLVWDAEFNREFIGDMPTEMFYHFFKSFSDEARCNLNIKVTGDNEHHKIEATFKALARAIKMAVKRDFNHKNLPTTKGVL